MHSLSMLSIAALFATGTLATPWNWNNGDDGYGYGGHHDDGCMTYDQASQVAAAYGTLIANYTSSFANAVLATNFTDYSESVNTLIDECPQGSAAVTLPLLSPTFTNRSSFELGQGQQAPINFQQLDLWKGCTSVTFRWITTNTAPIPNPKPVVGIIVAEVVPAPSGNSYNGVAYPWLIDEIFSEFDAGAWLANLEAAGFCASTSTSTTSAVPTGTSKPTRRSIQRKQKL